MRDNISRPGRGAWLPLAVVALVVVAGGGLVWHLATRRPHPPRANGTPSAPTENIETQVREFCGGCHMVPAPASFPKRHWKEEVEAGFRFFGKGYFGQGVRNLRPPPMDKVIDYYVERAPEELPPIDATPAAGPTPARFEPLRVAGPSLPKPYAISHVSLVRLFDKQRLDILACDMRNGVVMAYQPYLDQPTWRILGKVAHPAHAEVVDLDGDGVADLLVADLGSFPPSDTRCGSVVWFRGQRDGAFTPHTLLADVGRVADVQAADFRGVGKLDLVVAAFGWNQIGEVYLLENHTTDWAKPKFVERELDHRHGAIHVPVVDLNGDGKPDFVALFAQEHETIVAFLNDGKGSFEKKTIFQAPDPSYGSSGIQLVDMNADGRLDLLYTNGDTLDAPHLLKPYHGVQWLENPGDGSYPWKRHAVAPFYGAHRAVAADFCGTGKLDIAAVSFLPKEIFPQRQERNLDAVVLFERTGAATFARRPLESVHCDIVSCVAGDLFGSGRQDLVTAVFAHAPSAHVVTIWRNLGKQ